ncbi:unnamed protein product [Rotaria sp. Silwood2]|nr:unnamed protein product [Rotaria sp. Silwood2]
MTSQQKVLFSDRIHRTPKLDVDDLECSICRGLLWKPVACQSCETSFCSTCIHQWLVKNPKQCPNRCEIFTERKCPPFVSKLFAQLKSASFYQSNGCNQLVFKRADFDRKHTQIICLKEQLQQLQDESKENKREIHELNLQLDEMRILNQSIIDTKITFADLQGATDNCYRISDKYRGLKWTGMDYIHKSYAIQNYPTSGYAASFTPGDSSYLAFFREEALVSVNIPDEIFTFFSLTACAAWNDDLQLIITEHRDVVEIYEYTTTLLYGKPQFILLHWEDIDKIIFKSSGGTAHPGNGSLAGS